MKYFQNRVAEGGMTLPVAALFAMCVWLLIGLHTKQLWPQLACFVASVYLLVELSNANALLRVRSRMVSSSFLLLSCTGCFMFVSLTASAVQLCIVASFLILFQTYQDKQAVGRTFYAFIPIGVASIAFVHVLWYIPLLWVLMATQLQSLSWRSWMGSLVGVVAPYWFASLWFISPVNPFREGDMVLPPLADHFSSLGDFSLMAPSLSLSHVLVFAFCLVLAVAGVVHFWRYSFEDKIRIRLLYGFFTAMTIFTLVFIALQPQHFDILMRLAFVCASPLIAHVLTFTSSRLSNILFCVVIGLAVGITAFNVVTILTSNP